MSSYEAAPEAEELHLLGKLLPLPLLFTHSATLAIAERLSASGDAMVLRMAGETWLDITAQGRRRLLAETGYRAECPFCGCRPVDTFGSMMLGHPHGSRCLLADFATGNIAAWNTRASAR